MIPLRSSSRPSGALVYGFEQIHYRCRPFAVITGHIGRPSVYCRRRVRSSCAPELTPKEVDPGACAYGSSYRPTIGVLTALSCHSVERPGSKPCRRGLLFYAAPCEHSGNASSSTACALREAASHKSLSPTDRSTGACLWRTRRHTGSCGRCRCSWDLNRDHAQPSSSPYALGHEARGCPLGE